MELVLIAAVAKDGCIGRHGRLPWHIPDELKRFKAMTIGKPVIMGRGTWESLPRKPLPRRLNIVLTSSMIDGVCTAASVGEAVDMARLSGAEEAWVIGGASVYAATLPLAARLELTEVDLTVPDGDTWFPEIDPATWHIAKETHAAGPPDLRFRTLLRSGP